MTDSLTRVSVVMPAFNEGPYLLLALEAVLTHPVPGLEVIVVDDGSTPPLREMLTPLLPRIRYIYQENGGPGPARNRGIEEARGEWLAFCDADDLWHPRKLELQLAELERHPEANLCICNEDLIDGDGRVFKKRIRKLRSGSLGDSIFAHQMISMSAPLIRRQTLLDCKLRFTTERRFSEDWNFWMRGADFFQVCVVDQSLTCYRKLPSGRATNQTEKIYSDGLWAIEDAVQYHQSAGLPPVRCEQRRQAAMHLLDYHRLSSLVAAGRLKDATPVLRRLWHRPASAETLKACLKMLLALLRRS